MAQSRFYFDRYGKFRGNNIVSNVPRIIIPESDDDEKELYKIGFSRYDDISQKYYNNPNFGWLISLANPNYSLEFDIDRNQYIRVPFPLDSALARYNQAVDEYIRLYGEQ
jgi:hypothetical protein